MALGEAPGRRTKGISVDAMVKKCRPSNDDLDAAIYYQLTGKKIHETVCADHSSETDEEQEEEQRQGPYFIV